MLEIEMLLQHLSPILKAKIGVLEEIIKGIYSISSGGVTMKNIARWTSKGCSYRTIQRFFSSPIDWLGLNLLLLRVVVMGIPDSTRYVLAVDEVVEKKAGKQTWGVAWFYSSIAGKAIRAISNHVISLVDTEKEHSFVLMHQQTVKQTKTKPKRKSTRRKKGNRKITKSKNKAKSKRPAGRPKGSKNKQNVKKKGLLYESFEALLAVVVPLLLVICPNVKYVLGDGAYGNKTCCLIVRQLVFLHLISKLNRNTGLYLPYAGKYSGKGRPRKYGDKLDYKNLPKQYLVSDVLEDGVQTKTYQINKVWTRTMPYLINVIIITKTVVASNKTSRVVLFSTDLELAALQLIKFYALRFQIEFNFRDAKQYFGLADFKNIKKQQVQNAIGLALFMDNISLILIEQAKEKWQEEAISIQDLKAYYRADNYLNFILNTLKIEDKTILNQQQIDQIRSIGAVNRTKLVA